MTERRYRDDEVRTIFTQAAQRTTREPSVPAATEGLTLAQLQNIGREVGLDADVIARSAAALDTRSTRGRTALGAPVEVGMTTALPRAPTQEEWERLIAELRTTFRATGHVIVHGNLRQWSNGNLHACIEPSGDGYRLRLGSLKGDASAFNAIGAMAFLTGSLVLGASFVSGDLLSTVIAAGGFFAAGAGSLLFNRLRLPRWAEQRERQMKQIGARLLHIMREP